MQTRCGVRKAVLLSRERRRPTPPSPTLSNDDNVSGSDANLRGLLSGSGLVRLDGVGLLASGDDAAVITEEVLLEELLGEVLDVALGEGDLGGDLDLDVGGGEGDVLAELAGAGALLGLDAGLEVLLEGGDIENLGLDDVADLDDVLEVLLDLLLGGSLGELGSSLSRGIERMGGGGQSSTSMGKLSKRSSEPCSPASLRVSVMPSDRTSHHYPSCAARGVRESRGRRCNERSPGCPQK
jgi:hypothetical protein